jgi:hypothetical protein
MTDQRTEPKARSASPLTTPECEAPDDRRRVVCAIELGWRIACLYSDLSHPFHDAPLATVVSHLPAFEKLPDSDRFQLQVGAAASLARHLRLDAHKRIANLAEAAHAAATDAKRRARVRAELQACHTELLKELWASRDGEGKAYELGSSLFGTWDRLHLAYKQSRDDMLREWRAVFRRERVERITLLLDDLQTRLDPTAVSVVKEHLERWHKRIYRTVERNPETFASAEPVARLRKQVLTWRQLVTSDKEPEAYLECRDRRKVRHEFNRLMWWSLLRIMPISCAVVGLCVIAAMVVGGDAAVATSKALLAILGTIGVTQASLLVIARERLRVWTELLWSRAMHRVVCDVTCEADGLGTGPRLKGGRRPPGAPARHNRSVGLSPPWREARLGAGTR